MIDEKYVLIVFNDPEEDEIRVPKEVNILKKVAAGEVRGASCGPINVSFFTSDSGIDDITNLLNEKKMNFILVPEKKASHALPGYITRMFGNDFPKNSEVLYDSRDEKKSKSVKSTKLSLEDQLAEALKNEEFFIAARLRDKIAARDKAVSEPVKVDDESLKDFFNKL